MCLRLTTETMRVLVIHTRYKVPGGEEEVFSAETALLREKGHEVTTLVMENKELDLFPLPKQAAVTLWNPAAFKRVHQLMETHRPEVVHLHNIFPLCSPSVIHAAKRRGIPVVMTLHNYRLLCVNALLFRSGSTCEECLGRFPWRGIFRRCYRSSILASAVVAATLGLHRSLGTWRLVDRYIALTEFARKKFLQAGFPVEKVVVKPNFLSPDPGMGEGGGGYALFVGRLSPEKGIRTLLDAWQRMTRRIPLKIVGDGPLAGEMENKIMGMPQVEWLGRKPREDVIALMDKAEFLVFPSEWYEGFPLVLLEALAKGLPVLTTSTGSQATIVKDGLTGLHFKPGDARDLAAKADWMASHKEELLGMRERARQEYEAHYAASTNYELLMAIYKKVTGGSK